MEIISTNIANPTTVMWRGREVTTGIYKKAVDSIFLGRDGVKDDKVADLRVHGGEFKACYLFSADQYPYWKSLYPQLEWEWGMFGENLTVKGLNETDILVGDIYRIGKALVQITQPREPCYKLGIKFDTQIILEQFIERGFPGTYIRIMEEGEVKASDKMVLVEKAEDSISTAEFYKLLFSNSKDQEKLKRIVRNEALPEGKRARLALFLT
ncbi:MOSC domain-containing protein [Leptobacterium flavescens]|uniref:MOSC domain-containing protein n=1 Tax=Leptobacterium flavescens TaxID=472055 RepID=A0A6P0UK16_9FLAO|nr:MOSC domain-containing protein [Leptobacterium flavescens]NER12228.1 MOSC domain-containing protein [Leptobacterium flavescens]